ncbi:hypothetical protein ACFLRW_03750 [Acidobacteriota bacterium]
MQSKKIILPVLLAAFVFSLAFSLQAQDENNGLTGNFQFGYRMVDTEGALTKYKEDYNLEKGFRLFNLNLHYAPTEKLQNLFDSINLTVYNFGGDPFESFGLSVNKIGLYKFQYERKKSTYFYDDETIAGGAPYDHHSFDFIRYTDSANLTVNVNKFINLYMNYDRYAKEGESVTTFDINRVEFEFDKPIKEESKTAAFGVDFHINRLSMLLETKKGKYTNENSLFLPGIAGGEAGAHYPSTLDFFVINQPYDLETDTFTIKLNANPIDNLIISGSGQWNTQDMNLNFSEGAKGTDYLGYNFENAYQGSGSFERKFSLMEADLTYLLFDKLALVGAVRYNDFEQNGSMTIGAATESQDLGYDTIAIEGGLQFSLSSKFAITGGYRWEERELAGLETVEFKEETSRNGFFGNLKANLFKGFNLTLDYQDGNVENPYTLIGPTAYSRFRVTAKYRSGGLTLSTGILTKRSESDVFGKSAWASDRDQFNFRIGYHADTFGISLGYSTINVQHDATRSIWYPPAWSGGAGTFAWTIDYEGKSNLLDGSVSLAITDDFHVGGYYHSYKNEGFWEISRTMLKGYIEYSFNNGIIASAGYRSVDYEGNSSADTYKANIVELSFGYRWK